MPDPYDSLKLKNQLCFPLYAASREIVRMYTPYLTPLDLTYTQYIAMMVIWEQKSVLVKELGRILHLDSGTLTPVLKKLEARGYITRRRLPGDERNVVIEPTEDGMTLRERAKSVPAQVGKCVGLLPDEAVTLYTLLYKLLGSLESEVIQERLVDME